MTKDQGDEFRLENEEEKDVEAHGALSEPALDREAAEEEDDEVEGHMHLREPGLGPEPTIGP